MRDYVARIRATERPAGPLPPIWLATLRDKMLDLALEVADGAIWANGSFSHTPTQLARIPADRRETFALANMLPTVIDEDKDAARAIHRRTLTGYVTLPNYRNYWKQAGYEAEMKAIEDALDAGDRDALPGSDARRMGRRLHDQRRRRRGARAPRRLVRRSASPRSP